MHQKIALDLKPVNQRARLLSYQPEVTQSKLTRLQSKQIPQKSSPYRSSIYQIARQQRIKQGAITERSNQVQIRRPQQSLHPTPPPTNRLMKPIKPKLFLNEEGARGVLTERRTHEQNKSMKRRVIVNNRPRSTLGLYRKRDTPKRIRSSSSQKRTPQGFDGMPQKLYTQTEDLRRAGNRQDIGSKRTCFTEHSDDNSYLGLKNPAFQAQQGIMESQTEQTQETIKNPHSKKQTFPLYVPSELIDEASDDDKDPLRFYVPRPAAAELTIPPLIESRGELKLLSRQYADDLSLIRGKPQELSHDTVMDDFGFDPESKVNSKIDWSKILAEEDEPNYLIGNQLVKL